MDTRRVVITKYLSSFEKRNAMLPFVGTCFSFIPLKVHYDFPILKPNELS